MFTMTLSNSYYNTLRVQQLKRLGQLHQAEMLQQNINQYISDEEKVHALIIHREFIKTFKTAISNDRIAG